MITHRKGEGRGELLHPQKTSNLVLGHKNTIKV